MENEEVKQKNINPMFIVGILVAVAIIGGVLFLSLRGSDTQEVAMEPSNTPASEVAGISEDAETSMMENVEGQIINIEAGSFYYAPNEIRVKQGEKVTIILTAVDMMHDFNIDELGVKLPITKSGETNTVEFTATEKGEFEYYCSVGEHRANGQVGKLIVE